MFPAALFPFCAGVPAIGIGQHANLTTCSMLTVCFLPSVVIPVALILSVDTDLPPEGVLGVGQHPST